MPRPSPTTLPASCRANFLLLITTIFWGASTPALAQPFAVPWSSAFLARVSSEEGPALAVHEHGPGQNLWLEVTPMAGEEPAALYRLPAFEAKEEHIIHLWGFPHGNAIVCRGGDEQAVACWQGFLEPGIVYPVERLPGLAVRGSFRLADLPVADVRVAVVPEGLWSARPFTLPLARDGGGMRREVRSDEEGNFSLPLLAPGTYRLEALLPSGRVFRDEVFTLPTPAAARAESGGDEAPVWDLGLIEVPDGATVQVVVRDGAEQPVADVQVSALQGHDRHDAVTFEARTDAEGRAALRGFDLSSPATVRCARPGYGEVSLVFELLPTQVFCLLEPLAALEGTVHNFADEPLAATLTLHPTAEARAPRLLQAGADGRFVFAELEAGDYELEIAAPGYEPETRAVSLAIGQRERLEVITLLAGGEIEGRVYDAQTGDGIAGARLEALVPPGAARTSSTADGTFTLAVPRDQALVLAVSAEDHATTTVRLNREALRSNEDVEIALERGGWLEIWVEEPTTGAPCAGCRVIVHPGNLELETGREGVVLSETLAAGAYRVDFPRLWNRGSLVMEEPAVEVRRATVKAGKSTIVRFAAVEETVRVRFDPAPGPGWRLGSRDGRRFRLHDPESDGSFRVPRPGRYGSTLVLERYDAATGAVVTVRQGSLPPRFDEEEITFSLPNAALSGRISTFDGPLGGARIRLYSFLGPLRNEGPFIDPERHRTPAAELRTDATGTFHVPYLPAGVYNILVGDRPLRSISLRAGQALELGTFELLP